MLTGFQFQDFFCIIWRCFSSLPRKQQLDVRGVAKIACSFTFFELSSIVGFISGPAFIPKSIYIILSVLILVDVYKPFNNFVKDYFGIYYLPIFLFTVTLLDWSALPLFLKSNTLLDCGIYFVFEYLLLGPIEEIVFFYDNFELKVYFFLSYIAGVY